MIGGAAAVGIGVPLLAGCGGGDDTATGDTGSGPVAKESDIPVGGGVIYADRNLVVTQPTSGTFKVFSATCTHQGCQVNKVVGTTIDCSCHGSEFSISDGSVVQGPATKPLPSVEFTVKSGQIVPS